MQKLLKGVFASTRVPNEHAIAGAKRLRIVRDVLRLRGAEKTLSDPI